MLRAGLAVAVLLFVIGNQGPGQNASQLTGTVQDFAAVPVAGVLLTLGSLDRAFQTKSAADGSFRFDNLPRGLYELELSAPGFIKQIVPVEVSETAAQSLTIVLRVLDRVPDLSYCGPRPSVTYSLLQSDSPHLTGVVRDSTDAKPVRHAAVSLWRKGEGRPVFKSFSNQTGRVQVNNVRPGYYDLRVSRSGYRPAELKHLLVPGESGTFVDFPILKRKWLIACE